MKESIYNNLLNIARNLKYIPGMRAFLLPYYHRYATWRRNHLFRKNGVRVLREFDEIMRNNDIHYSVFAGTLLGAIRERGLLKHDLDLDTVMFNKNYSPRIRKILESNGFSLLHTFLVNGGETAREETYIKDGVSIDIYFIYTDKKFPTYQCDFHAEEGATDNENSMKKYGYVCVRRLEFPVSEKTRRVPFESIEVNALDNAEEWLSYRYGADYMTPDPNFRDKGNNPRIFEWKEVSGIMKCV